MAPWMLILILGIGLSASHPATKLEVIQGDAPVDAGAAHSKTVELTLPIKINDREQLITWVTYAMRLMASKINVTLADAEEKMPPEKFEKFKNSSAVITKFIDKMTGDGKNSLKSMMAGFKKDDRKKNNSEKDDDKPSETRDSKYANGVLPSKLSLQNLMPNTFSPFGKYINDIAMMNPFDNPEHQIFRNPDLFPPYDTKLMAPQTLLPLQVSSAYMGENSKNFYSVVNEQNSSGIGLNGKTDSPSNVHVVNLHQVFTNPKPSFDPMNFAPTTYRPTITVPFEAYVTITREKDESPSNSQSTIINLLEPTKKNMESRKTTVVFDESTTYKPPMQKKKKKKKTKNTNKKQQPNLLQSIARLLISNRTSTTTFGDIFSKLTKKIPNVKKQTNRGKRNETSQKQIDDDDDGRFGSDANISNDNGDNDTDLGGGSPNANDIFDDFDDDFNSNNDDYDYDGGGGSLGSLEDLLPLIIPVLEDISDPESDTDLGELLQAAIPLVQGLSEPDPETGEGPDIIGVIGPILQNLSVGKDGQGSDIGAILGPLLQLIGPFIGPLSGPLIGPLSSSSSSGEGSSPGALLGALSGPLSKPTEYGGKSPVAGLIADVTALLLKEISKPNSGIDLGQVVGQVVTGALSGTSAGLSGDKKPVYGPSPGPGPAPAYQKPAPLQQNLQGLRPPPKRQQLEPVTFRPARIQNTQRPSKQPQKKKPPPRSRPQATVYRPQATHPDDHPSLVPVYNIQQLEQLASPAHFGTYGIPANEVNPLDILFKSFKDILASGVNLFTAVLGGSTAASGASSSKSSSVSDSSSHHDGYGYGPPPSHYGPPSHQDSYQNIH